ncbi:hypothetical protein CHS0354_009469 [Potamilus streckersoni]|uniref:Chitin-binding type-4 domain-containing protein n=1 Tax=Potamilus streckersoni TaxID=2493646 RepID=A0AAE0VKT6_9BIVA|nr:hypothetical protein CHS0354_009469 [Potamilus streckersoni]
MNKAIGITGSWNRLQIVSTMVSSMLVSVAILHLISIQDASGHGALIEPPMRSVLWKYGFHTPINYNYTELYCGGFQKFLNNSGRCGVCGDPFQGPHENERGGKYDLGIIARSYPEGTTNIDVKVEITAHHKGYFEFKLCPNEEAEITQECLDRYPLMIEEGIQQGDPMKFYPPDKEVVHPLKVLIPPDMRCERCVLQWTYKTGNRWGNDPDGKSCLGCGMQEKFINCADISIRSHGNIVNTHFKSIDSLPVSDQTPSTAEEKHDAENIQIKDQELNSITANNTIPSMIRGGATEQLNDNIVQHYKVTTNTRQTNSHPVIPQHDITIQTSEGFTKAHTTLLLEQRISTTTGPETKANHSHMQISILNTTHWINPMQNSDRQGLPMGRHQPLTGISDNKAHLFPLHQIHMANTVQGEALGRHQPHEIRIEVQAMMALASPQVREFYQRLFFLKSLSNSHQLNKNLQNTTPTERDRAVLAAIHSLHGAISNTIHREALIRNFMLTQRQLKIDRRGHGV